MKIISYLNISSTKLLLFKTWQTNTMFRFSNTDDIMGQKDNKNGLPLKCLSSISIIRWKGLSLAPLIRLPQVVHMPWSRSLTLLLPRTWPCTPSQVLASQVNTVRRMPSSTPTQLLSQATPTYPDPKHSPYLPPQVKNNPKIKKIKTFIRPDYLY